MKGYVDISIDLIIYLQQQCIVATNLQSLVSVPYASLLVVGKVMGCDQLHKEVCRWCKKAIASTKARVRFTDEDGTAVSENTGG